MTPFPILEWDAIAHANPQRSPRWYAIGGGIAFFGAAYSILTGNWSFAMGLLLIGGVYFLLRNAQSRTHHVRIERGGILFDGTFTNWSDCTQFWLLRFPAYVELHIQRKKKSELLIQTGAMDPLLIRSVLSESVAERSDARESPLNALIRLLKL